MFKVLLFLAVFSTPVAASAGSLSLCNAGDESLYVAVAYKNTGPVEAGRAVQVDPWKVLTPGSCYKKSDRSRAIYRWFSVYTKVGDTFRPRFYAHNDDIYKDDVIVEQFSNEMCAALPHEQLTVQRASIGELQNAGKCTSDRVGMAKFQLFIRVPSNVNHTLEIN
jgi:hypothetical protein